MKFFYFFKFNHKNSFPSFVSAPYELASHGITFVSDPSELASLGLIYKYWFWSTIF